MKPLNRARVVVTADRLSDAVRVTQALNEAGVTEYALSLETRQLTHKKLESLRPDFHIHIRNRADFVR